jgi:hypothetical protein
MPSEEARVSEARLDGMSILIEKDRETADFADYFFLCDVYARDPRYKSRHMRTGQRRGLFRISKADLSVKLLYPMELDAGERCFQRAAGKVLGLYKTENRLPEKAQFAAG